MCAWISRINLESCLIRSSICLVEDCYDLWDLDSFTFDMNDMSVYLHYDLIIPGRPLTINAVSIEPLYSINKFSRCIKKFRIVDIDRYPNLVFEWTPLILHELSKLFRSLVENVTVTTNWRSSFTPALSMMFIHYFTIQHTLI